MSEGALSVAKGHEGNDLVKGNQGHTCGNLHVSTFNTFPADVAGRKNSSGVLQGAFW